MSALLTLRNVFWAAASLGEIVLTCYLIHRKLVRSHFRLFFYLCCTVAQSALDVVITMRFLAACEMARRILARYPGIWAFAQRVLLIVAAGVLLYTAVFTDKHLSMMILTVDRGAELAIASFIVGLLLFVRYYRLEISPLDRALSIGFSLYSCFYVVNDSLLEKWMKPYIGFWASWMSSRSWLACSSGSRRFACMLRPGNSSTPRACLPSFTEHYPLK